MYSQKKLPGDFCCLTKMKELENLMLRSIFFEGAWKILFYVCLCCFGSGVEGRQRGTMFKACGFGIYIHVSTGQKAPSK